MNKWILTLCLLSVVGVAIAFLLRETRGNARAVGQNYSTVTGQMTEQPLATPAGLGAKTDERSSEVAQMETLVTALSMDDTTNSLSKLPHDNLWPSHITKARRDGALAKITFLVVDDEGDPVPDANVGGGFYNHERKGHGFSCRTDADGTVVLEDLCVYELNFHIDKTGYYETRDRYMFFKNGFDCVKDGRWLPWNPLVKIVLKRKVNPVAMYVHRGDIDRLKLPKLEDWTGFDLERADWVSPHCKGKREDFQVFFRRGETNHMGAFRQFDLTFRFCGPFDGVYLSRKDNTGSQFKCTYEADTNRNYETEIQFTYERQTDQASSRVIYKNKLLGEEEYLVLRVRSETNKDGQLLKAHYAKICAPLFAAFYGFQITTYFNPEPNNASLEADTTRNLLNPGDLGFAP